MPTTTLAAPAESATTTTQSVSPETTSKDIAVSKPESGKPEAASKTETAAEKRRYKVKIDKDELEVDEDELIRGYQLRKASDKRFQTASEKEKQIEEIIAIMRTDPRRALSHPDINVNIREFAEKVLAEELEEELMDPKEKELRALRKERDAAHEKLKAREEEERKAKEEATIAQYTETYAKEIPAAITKFGLPVNPGVTNRVRDYMLAALDHGYEASALEVMPYVKEEYINEIKSMFSVGDAQVLADLLGEEGMKKVRTFDLSRLKNPKGMVPSEQPPEKAETKAKKVKSTDAYFEELRKKFGND